MIIDFDSVLWQDIWFRRLSPQEKLTYTYLRTCGHLNTSGIFRISVETIELETGIPEKEVRKILKKFSERIAYDHTHGICWIKDYVTSQFYKKGVLSQAIKDNILKNLLAVAEHKFVQDFCKRYHYLGFDENEYLAIIHVGRIDAGDIKPERYVDCL